MWIFNLWEKFKSIFLENTTLELEEYYLKFKNKYNSCVNFHMKI